MSTETLLITGATGDTGRHAAQEFATLHRDAFEPVNAAAGRAVEWIGG
jgi:NAD(P)-dependent dehydrogenase (short-subunit alcohol dehydrogenase family)